MNCINNKKSNICSTAAKNNKIKIFAVFCLTLGGVIKVFIPTPSRYIKNWLITAYS